MRVLVTLGAVLLCGSLGVVSSAAQSTSQRHEEKKRELLKRLDQMSRDLTVAKKALAANGASLEAAAKSRDRIRSVGLKSLLVAPAPDTSAQERAARALDRLKIDTQDKLNRKVDALILERLR